MSEILKNANYWNIYDNCKELGKKLNVYVAIIPYSNYTCVTLNVSDSEIFNKFKEMLENEYSEVKEDQFLRSFYVK